MDLETGIIEQLTDEPADIMTGNHTKCPDSLICVYIIGRQLKKLDTRTSEVTVLYEAPEGELLSSPFISPDKKVVGLIWTEDLGKYKNAANYGGFAENIYNVKRSWVTLVNMDGSGSRTIVHDSCWCNHFQFSPTDPNVALFCHEGPWNLVNQRMPRAGCSGPFPCPIIVTIITPTMTTRFWWETRRMTWSCDKILYASDRDGVCNLYTIAL